MDSMHDRRGCLASPLVRGGLGMIAIVVVLVFVVRALGDDATDTGAPGNEPPPEADVAPRAESGARSIALADGQTLDIDLFIAPTAETTIIAAPSRNADLTSITPVGESLVNGDCANVIAFDAQTADATPISLYQALFDLLFAGEFGPIFADGFGTLGASFTGLPSWQAARDNAAEYSFAFAPSDPFPDEFSPDEIPMPFLFVGEGDTGFLPQFEQWREAGFNGATVPGSEHGSALFIGENDDVVLSRIERALCF